MARISSFYGMEISMHGDGPEGGRPQFQARYGEIEASMTIAGPEVISGDLPPTALELIGEWVVEHRPELEENWRLGERRQPLKPIEPLP